VELIPFLLILFEEVMASGFLLRKPKSCQAWFCVFAGHLLKARSISLVVPVAVAVDCGGGN
jgi:hypothetical protein